MKNLLFLGLSLLLCSACETPSLPDNSPLAQEITLLPKSEQGQWIGYLQRSQQIHTKDMAFIKQELQALQLQSPSIPTKTEKFGFNPKPQATWFKTEEAKRIGDILLSFQTPSGGWSKRTDMATRARKPGEAFGHEQGYIPTFDNYATTTQIDILAQLYTANGEQKYKNAVLAGLQLVLDAQYPNGGWPQNFPLTGGYHDHITFNDEVVTNNLNLLLKVHSNNINYTFVPAAMRKAIGIALEKGINCLLNSQVEQAGRKTIWGAQHYAISLKPAPARKFEPAALASQESVEIVLFLMSLQKPGPELIQAVNAAYAWFEQNAIYGYRWDMVLGEHAALVADSEAQPLWGRFCNIGTNRPIFGDRDGSIHYNVEEISWERQIKYRWYTTAPNELRKTYLSWKQKTQ